MADDQQLSGDLDDLSVESDLDAWSRIPLRVKTVEIDGRIFYSGSGIEDWLETCVLNLAVGDLPEDLPHPASVASAMLLRWRQCLASDFDDPR